MKPQTFLACLLAGALSASTIPAVAAAQSERAAPYKAPRLSSGQPDLQGTWTNSSLTRLARAPQYGDRLVMTPEEVAAIEGQTAALNLRNNRPTAAGMRVQDINDSCATGQGGTGSGVGCAYNTHWIDPGDTVMRVGGQPRTSFITNPANGRVPLRPGVSTGRNLARFGENPETRTVGERCLSSFGYSSGPVMQPLLYNNNYQFAQSKDSVAILVEMVHDVRIIRLGGKHLPAHIRPWMGDSIGHWEGDTLVAETTNFPPHVSFQGSSENLKVTERFTRVAPDRMLYRFTVEDPTVFTQTWGGEYEFRTSNGAVFEYACHEGNYALEGILAGSRADEADVAAGRMTAAAAASRLARPSAPGEE